MKKPIIGITCDWVETNDVPQARLNYGYIRAVESAGGLPVLLPPQKEVDSLADTIQGLVIPGGDDIDPKHYEEELHEKATLIPYQRFEFERALLSKVLKQEKPVLGICYGAQLLNVVRGGNLYQHIPDLPDTMPHKRATSQDPHDQHFVKTEPNCRLRKMLGLEQFEIVSIHHQAIRQLGKGLQPSAYSQDGIIEAIEDPNASFVVGVQWHPERDLNSPATKSLFAAFVQACK